MKLTEARVKFETLRKERSRVRVAGHAFRDHPERRFTQAEVADLVCNATGILKDNHVANPLPDSFVWWCKDDAGRQCQIAVLFETDENGELVLAVSAYREV